MSEQTKGAALLCVAVLLLTWAYLSPLVPLMHLDADSRAFLSDAPALRLDALYHESGIYRILGFAFAKIIYKYFVTESNFASLAIVLSVGSRLLVLASILRKLHIPARLHASAVILAFVPLFWIDGALVLSRAINEFLAAVIACAYIVLSESTAGRRPLIQFALTALYLLVSLVTYESYAPVAVLVVLVAAGKRSVAIFAGGLVSFLVVMALQWQGSVLRNPKISATFFQLGENLSNMHEYATEKAALIASSLTSADRKDWWIACGFALATSGLFALGSGFRSYARRPLMIGVSLLLASVIPLLMMLVLARTGRDPTVGKLYWMMLANANILFAVGLVWIRMTAAKPYIQIVAGTVYTFGWVIGGVVIIRQFASAVATNPTIIHQSIFRGFTSHFGL